MLRLSRVIAGMMVLTLVSGTIGAPNPFLGTAAAAGKGKEEKKDVAAKKEEGGPEKAAEAHKKAQDQMTDKEHAAIAALVLEKLSAGVKGKELAAAIHEKQAAMKRVREEKRAQKRAEKKAHKRDKKEGEESPEKKAKDKDKGKKPDDKKAGKGSKKEGKPAKEECDKKGPGLALKHGLEEKDMVGLGKFVNEKLSEGLRGKKLAEAIHKEIERRKAECKRERERRKLKEKKGHGKGEEAGKGADHGKGHGGE